MKSLAGKVHISKLIYRRQFICSTTLTGRTIYLVRSIILLSVRHKLLLLIIGIKCWLSRSDSPSGETFLYLMWITVELVTWMTVWIVTWNMVHLFIGQFLATPHCSSDRSTSLTWWSSGFDGTLLCSLYYLQHYFKIILPSRCRVVFYLNQMKLIY